VRPILLASVLLIGLFWWSSRSAAAQEGRDPFTFVVTSDMRYFAGPDRDSSSYFKGVVEAIDRLGGGAFMVSPGDIDPPANVLWTITRTLGVTYTWYPVVGNHELPGDGIEDQPGDNMNWLNSYDYGIVNPGPTGCPTTTYSFDYGNAHFVALNEYCDSSGDDATDGDVPDHLYDWLADDLSRTDQVHVFVFGHEPAYPQPDVDNGRAYFCGHTHNYSAVNVDGVWQVDVGHARGAAEPGAPSTFVMVHVDGPTVTFDTYRDEHDGTYDYDDIAHHGRLAPCSHRSFQDGVSPTVSYAGTRDTYIDASSPDTNYGGSGVTTLVSDGDPDQAAMLQWDISSISPGSTVQAASITLSVTSPSIDTYELYEMKRDWVETEATWNHYATGNPWQQPGAQAGSDRGEDVLGAISASSTGLYVINLDDDGIGLVQRWVDDPSTNHGVIIADYSVGDAVRFASRHASAASQRPKLTVVLAAPRVYLPLVVQSPYCSLSPEEQQSCYFAHTNPDGFGPNYLVHQAGYVLPSYYGTEPDANNIESIAGGYPTAVATWQVWMGSPGHRAHLLGLTAFWVEQIEYGVGYAYDPTSPYRHYWVVITAKPGP